MYKPKLLIILVIVGAITSILSLPAQVTARNVVYPTGNPGVWIGNAWIDCNPQNVNVSVLGHKLCVGHQGETCHFTLNTWAYYQTNNFGAFLSWIKYHQFGQLRERYTLIGNCLNLTDDHPLEA